MPKLDLKKVICVFVWVSMLSISFMPYLAKADVDVWGDVDGNAVNSIVEEKTGLEYQDPRIIVANIIKFALSFLGILAVILILIGGFKWMTAGGNDDQVAEAKKWMYSGVVGLLIILAAYALATFVTEQIAAVVNA